MGPLYKEHISVQKSSHSLSSFPHLPFYFIEHTCKIFLRVVWISTFWLDNPLAWLVNSHIMSSNNSTVCEYEAGYKQEKQKSLEKELSKEKSQIPYRHPTTREFMWSTNARTERFQDPCDPTQILITSFFIKRERDETTKKPQKPTIYNFLITTYFEKILI